MRQKLLARKAELLNQFNFDIVVTALRATKFGWGAHIGKKTDKQVKTECRDLASQVIDSAIEYVLEDGQDAWASCGGFKAIAWPDGGLLLEFVLADAGDWFGESSDVEDEAQEEQRAGHSIIVGPRRILKLH